MISVCIPGKPIAKARPRFARRGKFVTTFNPQETEEGRFMIQFHNMANIEKPLTCPLSISCEFFMPRPKSHYGSGRNKNVLKQSSPLHHSDTPDIDNLLKFVLDSLNGYAWVDDSQIVDIKSNKVYCYDYPKTIITIEEVV